MNSVKKRIFALLTVITAAFSFISCSADTPKTVTLPAPITSKTDAHVQTINLNQPPMSVVVPPVTAPPETSGTTVFSRAETTVTDDPLAAFSNVPLEEYMGYATASSASIETGGSASSSTSGSGSVNTVSGSITASSVTSVTSAANTASSFTEKYPNRVIYRPYEYGFLTDAQNQLYLLCEDSFAAVSETLTVPENLSVTSEDFDTVYSIFLNKDPRTFYLKASAVPEFSASTDKLYGVSFSYKYPKVNVTARNEQLDAKVRSVTAGVTVGMTDYEKVIYFYDYLVKNVKVSSGTDDCKNAYGALVDGRADCTGYSFAMKTLLNAAGIEAITRTGTNGAGINHIWNMVKLDGDWYHLDVSFADLDTDYVNYDYCLTTDERIFVAYTAAKSVVNLAEIKFPVADSMEDNYYVKNGLFATSSVEAVTLVRQLMAEHQTNGGAIQILCATPNVWNETQEALLSVNSTVNLLAITEELKAAGITIDLGTLAYNMNEKTSVIKIIYGYEQSGGIG